MQRNQLPSVKSLLSLCGTLALAFFLVACGGSGGDNPAPSALQLIQEAQAALQKVTSYHFTLQSTNTGTSSSLPIQSATGDIIVPDKLQANATVLFSGAVVQAQIIIIGTEQYINVLGTWQKTTRQIDPRALADPKIGLSALLDEIQNPSTPSDSSSGGQSCWSINGKLDANLLTGITGGGAPAGTLDDVTTCIGKSDHLPYLLTIKGTAAQGDSDQTMRTIMLSKFNESITITAPLVAGGQ